MLANGQIDAETYKRKAWRNNLLSLPTSKNFPLFFSFSPVSCNNSRAKIVLQVEGTRPRLTAYLHKGVIEDVYAVCSFCFAWLFVKSVGLAFHVTWGLAKFVATLLFVIALPLLVVSPSSARCCLCCCPLALVAAAFCILKRHKVPNRRAARSCTAVSLSLRCRRGILVVRAFCACYHPTKRFFP